MGRRKNLSVENKAKLHRLSVNTNHIEIMTFDDLVQNALSLYETIFNKSSEEPSTQEYHLPAVAADPAARRLTLRDA